MTLEKRDQILELRRNGKGYATIAKLVGEKRDAVRYICKSMGLGGKGEDIHPENTCPECGAALIQPKGRGRHRRFCNEACRRSWWKRHPEEAKQNETAMYITKCECCGKDFSSYGNNHRRYCSRDCYIKMRFWT
jgi:hypothetical protein